MYALMMLSSYSLAADAAPESAPTALIELDGTGSENPSGGALAYRWTQIEGPKVTLSDPSSPKPNFRTGEPGLYRFELVVSANGLNSEPFVVEIMIEKDNQPPIAKGPRETSVEAGDNVTIDGSDSFDPEGKEITYRWRSLTSGLEIPAEVQGLPVIELHPEIDGIYQIELVVSDGETVSEPWITSLAVRPRPRPPVAIARAIPKEIPAAPEMENAMAAPAGTPRPIARIEGPKIAKVGQRIMLDAKDSSGSGNGKLQYMWRQTAGPFVSDFETIYDGVAERFTPPRPGEYQFELVVSDGIRQSDPVTHSLRITREPEAPVAVVVAPSRAAPGALVKLDATQSYDSEGGKLVYRWRQTGGPKVTRYLIDDAIGEAAPAFNPPVPGTYSFELVVGNGELSSKPVEIDIEVGAPVRQTQLSISTREIATVGETLSLSAIGNFAGATYVWRQVEGPAQSLSATDGKHVDAAMTLPGRYTFDVSALENGMVVATARRSVEVFPTAAPPVLATPHGIQPPPETDHQQLQPLLDMPPREDGFFPIPIPTESSMEPYLPPVQSGRPAAQIHPSSLGTNINFLRPG
jgi:hypothetical protein